jgi:hypothetical protein
VARQLAPDRVDVLDRHGAQGMYGDPMRAAAQFMRSLTRNEAVNLFIQASAASMGE